MPSAIIIEDDVVVASDLKRILVRAGVRVEGVAGGIGEARDLVEGRNPDLVLLDIGLRDGCGLQLARELADRGLRFVFVSGRTDRDTLQRAPPTGACGFVVKPFSEAQLVAAVTLALGGRDRDDARARGALARISNILVEMGIVGASGPAPALGSVPELTRLSSREWEVLRELLGHKRVPAIARSLHISQATVRNHLKSIFAKVGVHSQQELLERVVANSRPKAS